jgi:hypothetical protein
MGLPAYQPFPVDPSQFPPHPAMQQRFFPRPLRQVTGMNPAYQDTTVAFPWGLEAETMWQTGYTLGWNSFAQAQRSISVQDKHVAAPTRPPPPPAPTLPLPMASPVAPRLFDMTSIKPGKKIMNYKSERMATYPKSELPLMLRLFPQHGPADTSRTAHVPTATLAHSES